MKARLMSSEYERESKCQECFVPSVVILVKAVRRCVWWGNRSSAFSKASFSRVQSVSLINSNEHKMFQTFHSAWTDCFQKLDTDVVKAAGRQSRFARKMYPLTEVSASKSHSFLTWRGTRAASYRNLPCRPAGACHDPSNDQLQDSLPLKPLWQAQFVFFFHLTILCKQQHLACWIKKSLRTSKTELLRQGCFVGKQIASQKSLNIWQNHLGSSFLWYYVKKSALRGNKMGNKSAQISTHKYTKTPEKNVHGLFCATERTMLLIWVGIRCGKLHFRFVLHWSLLWTSLIPWASVPRTQHNNSLKGNFLFENHLWCITCHRNLLDLFQKSSQRISCHPTVFQPLQSFQQLCQNTRRKAARRTLNSQSAKAPQKESWIPTVMRRTVFCWQCCPQQHFPLGNSFLQWLLAPK